MSDEWNQLSAADKAAVERVIEQCRASGVMVRAPHGDNGEVYAYPHPNGRIAWGVDGGENGFNIARDIR